MVLNSHIFLPQNKMCDHLKLSESGITKLQVAKVS